MATRVDIGSSDSLYKAALSSYIWLGLSLIPFNFKVCKLDCKDFRLIKCAGVSSAQVERRQEKRAPFNPRARQGSIGIPSQAHTDNILRLPCLSQYESTHKMKQALPASQFIAMMPLPFLRRVSVAKEHCPVPRCWAPSKPDARLPVVFIERVVPRALTAGFVVVVDKALILALAFSRDPAFGNVCV